MEYLKHLNTTNISYLKNKQKRIKTEIDYSFKIL